MGITSLPVQLTSFIGREREMTEVERLISAGRLVTLIGAGGCGKTRLAIQVANKISDTFADGVWLVDFVPLREPGLVPQHVAQTLGLHSAPNQPLNDLLLSFAQPKQMLLILDNCEHLIAACNQLIQPLLGGAPRLYIIVTSRQLLGLSGEMIYPVEGLACPSFDPATAGDPQDLMQSDSVHLFVERARAISPRFAITPENAPAIVEICCRLDGIPLALELASARVNVLTAGQIAARLDDRFALLTTGQHAALITHHQTLRAAFDWSFDLLTPDEQTLLRRLAVFRAGFTLDTAEGICAGAGLDAGRILDLLSSLVDKSLVVAATVDRTEARYRLLETIREYALEKLKAAGEVTRLRDHHLKFFVARAEEIEPKLKGSAYQLLWLNWLEGELDNVRAVLDWAQESGQVEQGLRLAVALFTFWASRDFMREGRAWLERLLAQTGEQVSIVLRARAAMNAGLMAGFLGDVTAARAHEQTAVALCEAAGEAGLPLLAMAQAPKVLAAIVEHDFETAYNILERTTQIQRQLGDDYELIMALGTQALAATGMGKLTLARSLLDEALSVAHQVGDPYRTALIHSFLAQVEYYEQNYDHARIMYEESLAMLRAVGRTREEPQVLNSFAHVRLRQGDLNQAHTLLLESVAMYKSQGNPAGIAECLIGFGALAAERGMPVEATRLLTAGANLGRSPYMSLLLSKGKEYEHYIAVARAQLTEQAFERAQREGRMRTLEQALEYALSLPLVTEETAVKSKEDLSALTPREREIAALIGQGKTNGEISAQLVLSKRTVEKHVANILSKLEFTSRAEIVRWAIHQHLIDDSS